MKKFLAIVLVLVMLITIVPTNLFGTVAEAITANQVKSQLDSFLQKYPAGATNPKSNCYYFVEMLTNSIFGHGLPNQNANDSKHLNQYSFNHTTSAFKNYNQIGSTLVVKNGNLTEKNLKSLLSNAQPGDIIQMGYTKWNSNENNRTRSRHVMMVYSASETGIVLYHAGSKVYFGVGNGKDKLNNGSSKKEMTWSQLKYYFCNNADGLSLYRSKKISSTTNHSHLYTEFYDTTHPHKIYKKCNCGDSFYINGTKKLSSCSTCFPKPDYSKISANKITAYNGESITLSWTAAQNASYYNLKYKLNDEYYTVDTGLTSREYTYKFTAPGTYYFYVDSVNNNGYTQSNLFKVTVLRYKWDCELKLSNSSFDGEKIISPKVGKETYITWKFYDGLSGKPYSEIAKYPYDISFVLKKGNQVIKEFEVKNTDTIRFAYTFDNLGWYSISFGVNSHDPSLIISTLIAGYCPINVIKNEVLTTPSVPYLKEKTSSKVILKEETGYEYSLDGINWQTSNIFNNLVPSTEYVFYKRYAETSTTKTGTSYSKLVVKTNHVCNDKGNTHTYINSCDETCEICGEMRSINHIFSNKCDKTCNVCGVTRKVSAHKYTNSCDRTCNNCNARRTIKHTYKTTTTKATLTKNGTVIKKCTKCGYNASKTAINYPTTVKLSSSTYTYDGKVKTPSVVVKDSAGKTISSKYYTVTYASGRKNVGTYKVTIKFKGNYSGTKTLTFKINPINVSKCKIKLSATSYTYNGKVKKPTVTVKNASGTKLSTASYTVSYASGRKNVGTYKVTVKFKGNYSGSKTLTFKINPQKTSAKLTAGKKSLTVKVTKKTAQVTGYQIQYSTTKSFKSYKTVTLSKNTKTSSTIKKLTAKKTYYVRVRTYKTVSGKKYYSAWSTVVSKKTK